MHWFTCSNAFGSSELAVGYDFPKSLYTSFLVIFKMSVKLVIKGVKNTGILTDG